MDHVARLQWSHSFDRSFLHVKVSTPRSLTKAEFQKVYFTWTQIRKCKHLKSKISDLLSEKKVTKFPQSFVLHRSALFSAQQLAKAFYNTFSSGPPEKKKHLFSIRDLAAFWSISLLCNLPVWLPQEHPAECAFLSANSLCSPPYPAAQKRALIFYPERTLPDKRKRQPSSFLLNHSLLKKYIQQLDTAHGKWTSLNTGCHKPGKHYRLAKDLEDTSVLSTGRLYLKIL